MYASSAVAASAAANGGGVVREFPTPNEVCLADSPTLFRRRSAFVLTHPPLTPNPTLQSEGQLYAQVTRVLGGCKFQVRCTDGFSRQMTILKKLKRRPDAICRLGDIVLVERPLYATADKTCFLVAKLAPAEVKQVRRQGGIPEWSESGQEGEEAAPVDFDEEAEVEVNLDDL